MDKKRKFHRFLLVLLAVMALTVYPIKAVRQLEKGAAYAGKNCVE